METTEKIVEAYVRYVKDWATIPNIKCPGQYEIDLLAINPVTMERYHIETTVSISSGFSKLKDTPFDLELVKQRLHQAHQRRTLGYFSERKFGMPQIIETLKHYGFEEGKYSKIIVAWDAETAVIEKAETLDMTIWLFPDLMAEIRDKIRDGRTYFVDDTLRTIHLFDKALKKSGRTQ